MTRIQPSALPTPSRAWRAIAARRREQMPASRERLFVALQRLRPGLNDRALMRLARDPAVIAAATLPK